MIFTPTNNLVLGLFDWENIRRNIGSIVTTPQELRLEKRIKRCVDWIKSIGEIWGLYAFAPMHELYLVDDILYKNGFTLAVYCPKMGSRKNIDTTDDILIKEGTKLIHLIPYLTHVIIGSGDFGFAPMLEEAKKKRGIKIGVVAGDEKSISIEIQQLIDRHPKTGEPMKHILSQKFD